MKKKFNWLTFFFEFAFAMAFFIVITAIAEPPLSLEKIGRGIFLSLVLTIPFSLLIKRKQKAIRDTSL